MAFLFRAEAISVFEGGLRDFAAAPFLPARGVGASVFFVGLAMLRPLQKRTVLGSPGPEDATQYFALDLVLMRRRVNAGPKAAGARVRADLGPR